MADNTEVQKQATVQDVIDKHMAGVGGYQIAEDLGMDTEKVKQIIQDANDSGKFIPEGGVVTSQDDRVVALEEGENPKTNVETTKK